MVRTKLKLSYISNDTTRKATYKKRKRGLVKKVQELSTLCGVDACAIVYNPFDSSPVVWPSNSGAQRVISKFKALPEMDQQKKMVDNVSFTRDMFVKAVERMKRVRKENREMEMTEIMFQSFFERIEKFDMNITDLNDLGYLIDQFDKCLNRRKEILLSSRMEMGQSSNVVATSDEGTRLMETVETSLAPTTTINM